MNNSEYNTIIIEKKESVATIVLNRPEKKNAFNDIMIKELNLALTEIKSDKTTRVLVIKGKGDSFCSGADLEYLKDMSTFSDKENLEDSILLSDFFYELYSFPRPVIADVTGPALAGGCGLALVCDYIYCDKKAIFGFPEVKIGFIPAIVSAFALEKLNHNIARDMLLSGKILSAEKALEINLVAGIKTDKNNDFIVSKKVSELLKSSYKAIEKTKKICNKINKEQIYALAKENADFRKTDHFSEGISSFLKKSKPIWN